MPPHGRIAETSRPEAPAWPRAGPIVLVATSLAGWLLIWWMLNCVATSLSASSGPSFDPAVGIEVHHHRNGPFDCLRELSARLSTVLHLGYEALVPSVGVKAAMVALPVRTVDAQAERKGSQHAGGHATAGAQAALAALEPGGAGLSGRVRAELDRP